MKKISFLFLLIMIHSGLILASDSILVAHWPMDDGSGTVVSDLAGANNGILVGLDPATAWLQDGGIRFENTDGHHIEVPHADTFDFGNESFSISMLVRYQDAPTDTDRWIIKGTHSTPGSGSRYEVFATGGNTLRFSIDNGAADIKSKLEVPITAFVTGDWVHVVAVRDTASDKISLYANGALLGSEADLSGDISSGEPLWIGESTDEDGTAMGGDISDVRLYNYALGKDSIDNLFRTYGILGTNANLSGITLEPSAELKPAFSPAVFYYSCVLPSGTDEVIVNALVSDEKASLSGEDTIDVSSGSGVANIEVTAENGISKNTYTISFSVGAPPPKQLAFPGADGYGKYVTGGRGGAVYEVTNLNDDGQPGSLRWAVNQSGPRTIVFRVSGNIELSSTLKIANGDLTIAGQTAPGDGICLKGQTLGISASNVIIRYLRCRLGENWGRDALGGTSPKNSAGTGELPVKGIMIDHCSVSYGADETLSVYDVENVTTQWCIISESMNRDGHGYGGIMGGWGASLHHSLFAHHKSRSPRFCGARYQFNLDNELMDMRYNVIYNAGKSYGGEGGHFNVVKNYYKRCDGEFLNPSKPNPSETDNEFVGCVYDSIRSYWYVNGNYQVGNATTSADNWTGGGIKLSYPALNIRAFSPFPSEYSGPEESAHEAYHNVCEGAGATLPRRDTVDRRLTYEVRTNTGEVRNILADIPGDAFPALNSVDAPEDADHDGMPDEWETAMGLNPADPSDRNNLADDGYTMLEKYLNSIEFTLKVSGLSLSVTEENHIRLIWAETFLGEEGYIIERAEGDGEFQVLETTEANTGTFLDQAASLTSAYSYRIKAFNADNESEYSEEAVYTPVPVNDYFSDPASLKIYPNPASHTAYIEFRISRESKVSIDIINVDGKIISTVPQESFTSGTHTVRLNNVDRSGQQIEPGVYFCRLRTSDSIRIVKFSIL